MDVKNKKAVLVGLGRSSLAAAQLLRQQGAAPFISEADKDRRVAGWLEQATRAGIPCEIGGHTRATFDEADLGVLSPGVPLAAPCVQWLKERGVPVVGELELAARFCSGRFLAVTGTNGKTTVTTLLESMVRASGHTVALAGNNDTPLSQVALEKTQPEYIVLEVSSYQLETTDLFHPSVAAVLNLSLDHLGRHGTMEAYAEVKARIFMRQGPGDAAIVNADDPLTAVMAVPDGVHRYAFSLCQRAANTLYADEASIYYENDVIAPLEINPLPGRHNLANALAALAVMKAAGFSWDGPLEGLRSFKGVEHRIEPVLSVEGVAYYNDSKSTNTESLRVALESFTQPIVLIAGGRGKGGDYTELTDLVRSRVKHLVTIGEDAARLEAAFGASVPVQRASDMTGAVRTAHECASPGDIVLLSPGCASFDMYDNYEARGKEFKRCVTHFADGLNREKE